MQKDNYKCGPNWLPDWIFDEPIFNDCCKVHDCKWEHSTGKLKSDLELLKCCWSVAGRQEGKWWRLRAYAQSILMYFVLTVIPVSYIWYWILKFINK